MTRFGEHVFRAVALAALVACLAMTGTWIAERTVAGWSGAPLLLFCVLAAVEAYTAYQLLHGARFRTSVVQIALFLILAQRYVDGLEGHAPFDAGTPYVNARAFAYFIPVFLTWLAITEVMRSLAVLDRPIADGFLDASPVRSLTIRFFLAGTALFLIAAFTQPAVASFLKLPHGSGGGPLFNVLAYFLIGIVFLGHLEYAALRHRWQAQRTVIATGMAARWTRYVFLFTAAVALLAFVLPTNRTLGILGPGHDAWTQLVLLFRGPLSNLLSLLHPTTPTTIDRHLKPPPGFHLPPRRPPAPHHGGGHGGDWLSLIETILFWTGAIALIGYLVRAVVRRQRGRLRRPRARRPIGPRGIFARLWAAITARLRTLLDAVADRLPDRVAARLAAPTTGRRRFADDAIAGPTRQQILAYYRRMVRQAERRGLRHSPAQTPEEFAAVLAPEIPQAAGDVALLTSAFVEARYSHHDLPEGRLGPVRAGWDRIRQALRSRQSSQ